MKKLFLTILLIFLISCASTTYVQDDVYYSTDATTFIYVPSYIMYYNLPPVMFYWEQPFYGEFYGFYPYYNYYYSWNWYHWNYHWAHNNNYYGRRYLSISTPKPIQNNYYGRRYSPSPKPIQQRQIRKYEQSPPAPKHVKRYEAPKQYRNVYQPPQQKSIIRNERSTITRTIQPQTKSSFTPSKTVNKRIR